MIQHGGFTFTYAKGCSQRRRRSARTHARTHANTLSHIHTHTCRAGIGNEQAAVCFSVTAAHFLTLSVLENLRFFDPSKRDTSFNLLNFTLAKRGDGEWYIRTMYLHYDPPHNYQGSLHVTIESQDGTVTESPLVTVCNVQDGRINTNHKFCTALRNGDTLNVRLKWIENGTETPNSQKTNTSGPSSLHWGASPQKLDVELASVELASVDTVSLAAPVRAILQSKDVYVIVLRKPRMQSTEVPSAALTSCVALLVGRSWAKRCLSRLTEIS